MIVGKSHAFLWGDFPAFSSGILEHSSIRLSSKASFPHAVRIALPGRFRSEDISEAK
jgi:hypothetical protein